ncbi:MAG: hypothetical protein ACFE7E_00460 [Candidatus Hodarchaeota archaeon]
MDEIMCPNCRRRIPAFHKFCQYCGAVLPQDSVLSVLRPPDYGEFLPEKIKEQLEIRGQLAELKDEKYKYYEKIKKLEKDLSGGKKSLPEIESELNKLKKRIKEIKNLEKGLTESIEELPFEEMLNRRKTIKERMKKLDGILEAGRITEEVYHKLRKEFKTELEIVDGQFSAYDTQIKHWLSKFKSDIKENKDELALLYARYQVGQVSEKDYSKKKEELEKELKSAKRCFSILKTESAVLKPGKDK